MITEMEAKRARVMLIQDALHGGQCRQDQHPANLPSAVQGEGCPAFCVSRVRAVINRSLPLEPFLYLQQHQGCLLGVLIQLRTSRTHCISLGSR